MVRTVLYSLMVGFGVFLTGCGDSASSQEGNEDVSVEQIGDPDQKGPSGDEIQSYIEEKYPGYRITELRFKNLPTDNPSEIRSSVTLSLILEKDLYSVARSNAPMSDARRAPEVKEKLRERGLSVKDTLSGTLWGNPKEVTELWDRFFSQYILYKKAYDKGKTVTKQDDLYARETVEGWDVGGRLHISPDPDDYLTKEELEDKAAEAGKETAPIEGEELEKLLDFTQQIEKLKEQQ